MKMKKFKLKAEEDAVLATVYLSNEDDKVCLDIRGYTVIQVGSDGHIAVDPYGLAQALDIDITSVSVKEKDL
jgi:hypothetical protein